MEVEYLDTTTMLLAGVAAALGIGFAIIVWVWASGQIKRLQLALDNTVSSQSRLDDIVERTREQTERLHTDLASSCEFLRSELTTSDNGLREMFADTLAREERERKQLATLLADSAQASHSQHGTVLETVADLSESQNQIFDYIEAGLAEIRRLLQKTQEDMLDAVIAREKESQTRDHELTRQMMEMDDRLSNALTTRVKQIIERISKLEEETQKKLKETTENTAVRLTSLVTETEQAITMLRQEVGKEVSDTRAYIEDSLRERRRDLMA